VHPDDAVVQKKPFYVSLLIHDLMTA